MHVINLTPRSVFAPWLDVALLGSPAAAVGILCNVDFFEAFLHLDEISSNIAKTHDIVPPVRSNLKMINHDYNHELPWYTVH